MRIAFGHKARVGKDELCNYLESRFGGKTLRIADGVYKLGTKIQEYYNEDIVKDPNLLQMVGLVVREICGDDVWIRSVINQIEPEKNYYIPDMRFKNEFKTLKDNGFITIKINRPNRPIDRDPNHISEIDLDDTNFDYVIENDKTLSHLKCKLNYIIYISIFNTHIQNMSLNIDSKIHMVKFIIDGEWYAEFGETYDVAVSNTLICIHEMMNLNDDNFNVEQVKYAHHVWRTNKIPVIKIPSIENIFASFKIIALVDKYF